MFAPIESLPYLKPALAKLVRRAAGGDVLLDLALHLPAGVIDRSRRPSIAAAPLGELVTIRAVVEAHLPPRKTSLPYRIRLRDESGVLTLVYFRAKAAMLQSLYPVGAERVVSGRLEEERGELQMAHPDAVANVERGQDVEDFEPVYPLSTGLSPRTMLRVVRQALARLPELPEWADPALVAREAWPPFTPALKHVHAPRQEADLDPQSATRLRLAYDELFARQLALKLTRDARRALPGVAMSGDGALVARVQAGLPYRPTSAQRRAFADIAADMARPEPMSRLLQGDVGSGKTLVAALAIARAAEAGKQAALMAPTEVLARQHAETIGRFLDPAGLRVAALTGRDKGRARASLLEQIRSGEISALAGTHALFQSDVAFRDLGLVIIDEQHRFGVSDRARLVEKGRAPDLLAMSATPIPRTLALAAFGDLDICVLDEMPPGRKPVATRALPNTRLDEVVDAVARAVAKGERIYWVCPMVAHDEDAAMASADLAAASDRAEDLRAHFPGQVGLVHGRLSPRDKDAALNLFRTGEAAILVATTVIEVGVDVPEATVIVIEHAERFGLAQLHQLRGRVGRGQKPGVCLLVYAPPLSETGRIRLDALRRTNDGFDIAEMDFKLRGAGDVLGVKQSGLPQFRLADAALHARLIPAADRDARLLVERDPRLESPRGLAARLALRVFGYEDPQRLFASG
jgi:ATP-dependent DNA helicase RecG